jgi:hypothetical protein
MPMGLVGTLPPGSVGTVSIFPEVKQYCVSLLFVSLDIYDYSHYRSAMRTYTKKSRRGLTPPDIMLRAVRAVKIDKRSLRETSRDFEIPLMTLRRYCLKFSPEEFNSLNNNVPQTIIGYIPNRQVSIHICFFISKPLNEFLLHM